MGKPSKEASMAIAGIKPAVRSTRQRSAVAGLLDELEGFHSAQDIHDLLTKRGEAIGLTTVYRSLQLLADANEVDVIHTENGESAYRRCSPAHHHHLVCRNCGRTVEVDGPAVERWAQDVSNAHGFVAVDHTVEVVGTCPDCHAHTEKGRAPTRGEPSARPPSATGAGERAAPVARTNFCVLPAGPFR
jgi:Fur family ferric uptake transcriptional regulator